VLSVTSKLPADKGSQQTAQIGDLQPALVSQNLTASSAWINAVPAYMAIFGSLWGNIA
jgi:hypothetical protein